MDADALATTCMVKGYSGSTKFIEKTPLVEGYLVYIDDRGKTATWMSSGFKQYID